MSRKSAVTVRRDVDAPAASVWAVLSDGWIYPMWVVGAARSRSVDGHWPAVGAVLHHSVGVWPMLLDDRTEVLEVHPYRMIRLKARAVPTGVAEVTIQIEDVGAKTTVSIEEDAVGGPGALIPKPLRQLLIVPRNRETLRRLALLAEGRESPDA